mgnify:CR=1 FL=1
MLNRIIRQKCREAARLRKEELASSEKERLAKKGLEGAKAARATRKAESSAEACRKARPIENAAGTQAKSILVPENDGGGPKACKKWKSVEIPEEVAQLLIARSRKHFSQAHGPFPGLGAQRWL